MVRANRYLVQDQDGVAIPFEDLYDQHFQGILRYTLYRVGNQAEAQDLAAQTFFKALRGLWRFRWSGGSFSAWLYRIATNEVNSHLRRRRPALAADVLDRPATPGGGGTAAAEHSLAQGERFRHLSRALQRLKAEDQTLVVLRYVEEKPYSEIAAILRKRVGAVTMATHRALQKLRLEVERQEVAHGQAQGRTQKIARPAGRTVPADAAP